MYHRNMYMTGRSLSVGGWVGRSVAVGRSVVGSLVGSFVRLFGRSVWLVGWFVHSVSRRLKTAGILTLRAWSCSWRTPSWRTCRCRTRTCRSAWSASCRSCCACPALSWWDCWSTRPSAGLPAAAEFPGPAKWQKPQTEGKEDSREAQISLLRSVSELNDLARVYLTVSAPKLKKYILTTP